VTAAGVLVVDDDADIREVLAELLVDEGYHAMVAVDGREALGLMERTTPGLIITDVMMPGMDGLALLEALHGPPDLACIPVLVCTALPREQVALALGRAGLTAPTMQKPMRFYELLDAVHELLGGAPPPARVPAA
jgi:CheY-like chemotaxis protein